MPTAKLRPCSICGEMKKTKDFHKKSGSNEYFEYCKSCVEAVKKMREEKRLTRNKEEYRRFNTVETLVPRCAPKEHKRGDLLIDYRKSDGVPGWNAGFILAWERDRPRRRRKAL